MSVSKETKASKSAKDYHVTRISKETYEALRVLGSQIVKPGGKKKKPSLNEILEGLIDTANLVVNADPIYLVAGEVYTEIETARGEAVMNAARLREEVQWPHVAIVIGRATV